MNQTIKDTYRISFWNTKRKFDGFPTTIEKFPNTINYQFTLFLLDWSSPSEIDEELLPIINRVLSSDIEEDCESNSTGVVINPQNSIFYNLFDKNASHLNPDFTIPTLHFKEILIGWRDFLMTPPFNLTEVRSSILIKLRTLWKNLLGR